MIYTYISYIHIYHACMHTYIHTYIYIYTGIHTYIHIYIYTYIHIHIYIYIYIHTYIYTYIHIHIYIYIYIHIQSLLRRPPPGFSGLFAGRPTHFSILPPPTLVVSPHGEGEVGHLGKRPGWRAGGGRD